LRYENIFPLKVILDRFSELSGLKCNYEKTSIMRIGDLSGEIDQRIIDLGFQIVDNCKILGFNFSQKMDLAETNKGELKEKIKKNIRFWNPFNLSTTGPITVAKNLLLPHLIYFATILNFSDEFIEEIQTLFNEFIIKDLNISKEKITCNTAKGGLNFFNMNEFIMALQCTWILRTSRMQHDNWRNSLYYSSTSGILNIQQNDVETMGPIINGIVSKFVKFRNLFGTVENNFLHVPLLNNSNFFYRYQGRREPFNNNFFLGIAGPDVNLARLTWADLITDMAFKSKEQIFLDLGQDLNDKKYFSMSQGFRIALTRFYTTEQTTKTLSDFLAGVKKGSKKFRIIIGKSKTVKSPGRDPILSFARIVEFPVPVEKILVSLNPNPGGLIMMGIGQI
jgi:hypothetical protein